MLALKIAWRYLRAKKSHNAVNIITIISIAGIAVATMAMVVVMSIFNGFASLAESHLSRLDPDLKAERTDLRSFDNADSLAAAIEKINGVRAVLPSIESRALLVSETTQTPVRFRGVTNRYHMFSHIDSAIIDGMFATSMNSQANTTAPITISVGVANALKQAPDAQTQLNIYVPRREGRINPANPSAAFNSHPVAVSGVFSVEQPDYDNDYIIIPIDAARELLEYDTQAHALEIYLNPTVNPDELSAQINNMLGTDFSVKDRLAQHAEAFRMISLEKWITFMMLVFILVIALFNIISTLSLLVIEKRSNMETLLHLGATPSLVRRIFTLEGWLITLLGGAIGMVLGVILTFIQQYGKIIKLSANTSQLAIEAYPVTFNPMDLIAVAVAVTLTGLLASQCTRLFVRTR